MQAIQTRFIGPTNFRGSRYKAFCDAGSLTVDADHRYNPSSNHALAAGDLARKLGWHGNLVGGQLPSGDYAWVWTDHGCDSIEVPKAKE